MVLRAKRVLSHLLPALALLPLSSPCLADPLSWPEDRILPSFPESRRLEVIDASRLPAGEKLLLASLQGLVNRRNPSIYVLDHAEEGKSTWLDALDLPKQTFSSPLELVRRHRGILRGIVVYDPDFADSVNLATTLAGQKDALIASPDLAEILRREPHPLPVLDDLRGRFSNRLEAYRWQFSRLAAGANPRLLVGIAPGRFHHRPGEIPKGFVSLLKTPRRERSSSNRQVHSLDLSRFASSPEVFLRFQDAFPDDGWGAAVGEVTVLADGREIARFRPGSEAEKPFLHDAQRSQVAPDGRHRFADQDRHFTYRFPVPQGTARLEVKALAWNQLDISAGSAEPRTPWSPTAYLREYAVATRAQVFWLDANAPAERELFESILRSVRPGTPYLGWFGNDIEGEFSAVELTSSHGVPVVPADWCQNLSILSATRLATPAPQAPQAPPAPKLEPRIYVTLTFSEGDNLQYNQHRLRVLWNDRRRGEIPLNWTTSPLLADAAPVILDHYRRTATPNDCLMAGPSGAGYFYPAAWPREHFPVFLKQTRSYLDRTQLHTTYVLNRIHSRDIPLTPELVRHYRDHSGARGLFLGWGTSSSLESIESLPVAQLQGVDQPDQIRRTLEQARRSWDGKSPKFLALGLFAWRLTPTHLAEIASQAGPEFSFVRGDHFLELARRSLTPENPR